MSGNVVLLLTQRIRSRLESGTFVVQDFSVSFVPPWFTLTKFTQCDITFQPTLSLKATP